MGQGVTRTPEAWRWARVGAYTAGELQVEVYPAGGSVAGKTPIIFAHGFSLLSQPSVIMQGKPYVETFGLIAERTGCPVVAADFAGNPWANDTAIGLWGTLRTWLAANIGVRADKFFACGESMGSLLALNLAWRNPVACIGYWVRAPIVAMQTFHDTNPGGLAASMEAAYTNLAGLIAAYPTHDPAVAANRSILASFGRRGRVDWTGDDEFISPEIPRAYVAATGALGYQAHGNHNANSFTPPLKVADWITSVLAAYA